MLQGVVKPFPLVLAFVIGMLSSASASTGWTGGNEEDAAAPVGSFTSDMQAPVANPLSHSARHHQERWAAQGIRTAHRPHSEIR